MTEATVRRCRGPGLLRAVRGATANVERHVPELNALNVYPVPDGDTGINMIATLRAALAEVEQIPDGRGTLSDLAAAISFGALMGARGNSGVILSQVFRGMAESAAGKRRADGRDLADALLNGTRTAYGAVARPVEGTILTVVREAAQAAHAAADRGEPLGAVLLAATDAARQAVERTPEQLDILREAGVVDAGGQGFYRALEGALLALREEAAYLDRATAARPPDLEVRPGAPAFPAPSPGTPAFPAQGHHLAGPTRPKGGSTGWGYETVFLLQGREPLEPAKIRRRLEVMGESVLVAGDAAMVKVHVHNARPDEVLALGLSLGSLSQVSVQNLDEQTREAFVGAHAPADSAHEAGAGPPVPADSVAVPAHGPAPLGVVAVAAGEGIGDVFRSFGVAAVVAAPRSGRSSAGELLEAIRRVDAGAVIVLPNDPNVVLAAEQAARACREKEVVVVPTRSAPEGFAALLAMDAGAGARANLAAMLAAAGGVQTLGVAVCVRPTRIGGQKLAAGQIIVLRPDEALVAAGDDALGAVTAAVEALEPGYELLTFYRGEGAPPGEAEAIARAVSERRPGTEIEIIDGGQPHYRYLISAE